jgi:hypothetical protein
MIEISHRCRSYQEVSGSSERTHLGRLEGSIAPAKHHEQLAGILGNDVQHAVAIYVGDDRRYQL